jgi:hypothetical protein
MGATASRGLDFVSDPADGKTHETEMARRKRRTWPLMWLVLLLLILNVFIGYYFIGSFVFPITLISLIITLLTISLLIVLLREHHATHVYTLWYLFFFMSGCGFGIYVFLDKRQLIEVKYDEVMVRSSANGEFLEQVLTWFINISNNLMEEVIFLFYCSNLSSLTANY